ncbi:MAG: right-handed parallel beta-helix repeat-containing protein [Phycisphaerales bacterium]
MNDSPLDRRFLLGGLAGVAGISALTAMSKAGGPLNPPAGAVAPTSKPLGEIEPRVAINATNTPSGAGSLFRITQPGSYYLTGNVNVPAGLGGVFIAVGDVTVDLNGFSIIGAAGTGAGISSNTGVTNITVRNGAVRNFAGNGIDLSATPSTRVEDMTVSGCAQFGIVTGDNALVSNCSSTSNASGTVGGGGTQSSFDGISVGVGSIVRSCAVRFAGRFGIYHNGYGLVTDCFVSDAARTPSIGIFVNERTVVRGCQVSVCTTGIRANFISRVESCHVNNCTQFGILCDSGGVTKIIDNDVASVGTAAGHAAIRIGTGVSGCTVEGNRLEFNFRHIEVLNAANMIVRNTMAFTGAGGPLNIVGGNSFGPLVVVGGVGNIAGTAGSDHPQANFAY